MVQKLVKVEHTGLLLEAEHLYGMHDSLGSLSSMHDALGPSPSTQKFLTSKKTYT